MSSLTQLDPLPHRVYFVTKNIKNWKDVIEGRTPPIFRNLYERIVGEAKDCWGTQPYILLKERGLDVELVAKLVPNQICILTYEDLTIKDFPFRSYVVCCRHDRGRPEICEQRIVQNPLNIIDKTDHFLPHFSQPFIESRDPNRKTKIENLVYKGLERNLAQPFKTSQFLAELEKLEMQLLATPNTDEKGKGQDYRDYTQADVVLAVRNCTEYNLSIKPPSKLINAWFAEVPALLGPEPAYQHLRRSELDYIEVRSPEDVIDALKQFKHDPDLYLAMIENGRERAQEFTHDQIALLWRNLLAGEIARGYEQWSNQSTGYKTIGRPLQFAYRALKHKREKKHYFDNIFNGPRLFDDIEEED